MGGVFARLLLRLPLAGVETPPLKVFPLLFDFFCFERDLAKALSDFLPVDLNRFDLVLLFECDLTIFLLLFVLRIFLDLDLFGFLGVLFAIYNIFNILF